MEGLGAILAKILRVALALSVAVAIWYLLEEFFFIENNKFWLEWINFRKINM